MRNITATTLLLLLCATGYAAQEAPSSALVTWEVVASSFAVVLIALVGRYVHLLERRIEHIEAHFAQQMEAFTKRSAVTDERINELHQLLLSKYHPKDELREMLTAATIPILNQLNALDRGLNTLYNRIINNP